MFKAFILNKLFFDIIKIRGFSLNIVKTGTNSFKKEF